jgi:hypothetical protein
MVTPITSIEAQDGAPAPLDAMTIAATQRRQLMKRFFGCAPCARRQKPISRKTKNRGPLRPVDDEAIASMMLSALPLIGIRSFAS